MVDQLDPGALRRTLSHFASGIVVITAWDMTTGGDQPATPVGLTCQSFSSLSLDPALVVFSVARTSQTWPLIERSGRLAVNILADSQREISATFAVSGGDKFARVAWHEADDGLPVLDGTIAHITGRIERVLDGGDHQIVVVAVDTIVESNPEELPLLYFRSEYRSLGVS